MHQGSAFSLLLFVIVMEAISREFGVASTWELLYADDLVVIAETVPLLTANTLYHNTSTTNTTSYSLLYLLLTFSTDHNLGFIHVYSHASVLHVILPFI